MKKVKQKQNTYTLLSTEELKKINRKIMPLFGTKNKVTSGSYEQTTYYITIGDTSTYKSPVMMHRIGEMVKEVIGASEVYCLGTKIA